MTRWTHDNLRRFAFLTIAMTTALVVGSVGLRAGAQDGSSENSIGEEEMSPEEYDRMITQELNLQWASSPATAPVGEQAEISLASGLRFLETADAQRLLEGFGNLPDDTVIGLLSPENSTDWFVVFSFEDIGYVKDDEKDSIDKEALMEHFRQSNEAANAQRLRMGLTEMTLLGWAVEPYFNDESKSLEWGVKYLSDGYETVNYFTKRLGRHGVMTCNLIVDPEDVDEALAQVRSALDGFSYVEGAKYAQFQVGDKVAEYGLTALAAGGALAIAAKSGLLGKLWKVIVVAVLAAGAFFKKVVGGLFGRPAHGEG